MVDVYTVIKSLMTEAEKEECSKIGLEAFLEKYEEEPRTKKENERWRQKRK